MDNFEKHISEQIQIDSLPFEADQAIHDRLMYHMQLKSAQTRVRRNALLPSLALLLSSKFIALKLGAIVAIFIFFMGYQQMNQQSSLVQFSDTAQVIQNIDTTQFAIEDSLRIN